MLSKQITANWKAIDDFNSDPSIPNADVSDMALDFDFGLYYKTGSLYLGLSATHLNESDLNNISSGAAGFSYELKRHYYIMAGYDYRLGNPKFVLQPSVFVKSDGASAQVDVNLNVLYNNQFWGGVSYRVSDAIVPMVGMKMPVGPGTLKFGFAYDVTTSLMSEYIDTKQNIKNGTITGEVMVGYCFRLPDAPKVSKHKTVRFL